MTSKLAATRRFFSMLHRYLGSIRWFFYFAMLMGVVDALCNLSKPLVFQYVLNGLQTNPTSFMQDQLWTVILMALGIVLVFLPSAYIFHVGTINGGASFTRNLQVALHQHVQGLSADFFQRTKVGEITTRLNQDFDAANQLFTTLGATIWMLIILSQSIVMMFIISWKLAIFFIPIILIVTLLSRWYMPKIRKMNRSVRDSQSEVAAMVTEYIGSQQLIQAFSREEHMHAKVSGQADDVLRRRKHLSYRQFLFSDSLQVMMNYVGPLGLVVVGGFMLQAQKIMVGDLVAFWTYWQMAGMGVRMFSEQITQIFSSLASIDRIHELFREVPSVRSAPDAPLLQHVRGEISFHQISFRYPNSEGGPVLQDFNLCIEAGKTTALVGPSGAGKSTLLQMIMRFYDPECGSIHIDGHNIQNYKLRSLRENIGVVMQESMFFSGTIAENLRLAKEDASDQELWHALEQANAHDFVREMPRQLEEVLGERGIKLSGGQKQRLSIARVFLKNPPILLLDEATSALDSRSEKLVQQALERVMKHRTTLIVAHRLATVQHADDIVVLDRGKILARGTHTQLVETNDLYRELALHQGL